MSRGQAAGRWGDGGKGQVRAAVGPAETGTGKGVGLETGGDLSSSHLSSLGM